LYSLILILVCRLGIVLHHTPTRSWSLGSDRRAKDRLARFGSVEPGALVPLHGCRLRAVTMPDLRHWDR